VKKRRMLAVLLIVALAVASFSGCGKKKEKEEPKKETKQVVQEEEEPEEVEEPEVNQETFAIFGVDSRENNLGKGTRSDSLMVVNVDNTNKKVYIASVYRDCYVQIEGHGLDKITHAHSFGGPELAMDTLNTNFDLDIQKYITVNFINYLLDCSKTVILKCIIMQIIINRSCLFHITGDCMIDSNLQ
jgi:polyisoprenyl-teichoic acid--peptidoglycan teichoic acid transferase